jgi:hypothetical protein
VSPLRRLEPTEDSLQTEVRVMEDDLDRLHAFGGLPGDRSTATHKLDEVGTQHRMQVVPKPRDDAAAFARCEAQARIRPDDQLDAAADDLAIAAGMRPVAPPGPCRASRPHDAVAVGVVALSQVPNHTLSKPQSGPMLNSPESTALVSIDPSPGHVPVCRSSTIPPRGVGSCAVDLNLRAYRLHRGLTQTQVVAEIYTRP